MTDHAETTPPRNDVAHEPRVGISAVLKELAGDHPGITASKLRFLEDKGLVHPARTASGYRKFSRTDIDRLRRILEMQRDRYLPLKVIRERLDADEDTRVADGDRRAPEHPAPVTAPTVSPARTYNLRELAARTGAGVPLVRELVSYGLIREQDGVFDDHALAITRAALALTAHGLEPRHLRPFKAAADRELGLVERAVAPLASRRDPASRARAVERAQEISGLCLTIHTSLVRSEIAALQERAAVEG
ncbi:MerR family transcriptional regulator [Kocuria dechangensis]|uniref:MerR family transcriptional regulator n=1 Tax=Kocuria dechangensis TaxID=1176249 RepID=A0A917GZT1_9MICC|nr:MerR family transcriptional regulator [Kocuria dechangensis]GGG62969.1 MerR family transcriptional regulator [Kocuria dechangensis]